MSAALAIEADRDSRLLARGDPTEICQPLKHLMVVTLAFIVGAGEGFQSSSEAEVIRVR